MSHVLHTVSSRRPTASVTTRGLTHTHPRPAPGTGPIATWSPLALQRLAGNRAATLLVQRARGDGAAPRVAADAAAQQIITWLTANGGGGQQVNYSVGTLPDGDLVISKVNGVTAATALVRGGLATFIRGNGLEVGRDIYLAQKFNTATGSNHAEMCILAAAPDVTMIYCTGPHCAFCATVMTAQGVELGAGTGGSAQMGWTHPSRQIAYGSQSGETDGQLAELDAIENDLPLPAGPRAHTQLHKAPNGRKTKWL